MAIRRTKQDKHQAQVKRDAQLTYSWHNEGQSSPKGVSTRSKESQVVSTNQDGKTEQVMSILGYNPTLIYQDLMKTVVVTVLCVGVLVGIKIYFFS